MSLVEQIEKTLEEELDKLLTLEAQIEALSYQRDESATLVRRHKRALDALTGELEEEVPRVQESVGYQEGRQSMGGFQDQPREVPPPPQSQKIRASDGIPCPACGSGMEYGHRELNNGKTVRLLVCRDSGCNNEILAS